VVESATEVGSQLVWGPTKTDEGRTVRLPRFLPESLRAHDLRHTAASLLSRRGTSVKAVQKTLGHKSAVMTLDRYGHLWPDELEDLAERLDRARAAATATEVWPQRGPAVVQVRKGQVIDLALWWRWGDSNSGPPPGV
jgi:hypothetical protein